MRPQFLLDGKLRRPLHPIVAFRLAKAKFPGSNLLEVMKPFDISSLSKWIIIDRRHGKGIVDRFSTLAGFFFH
jgi:torulene dioxygenase